MANDNKKPQPAPDRIEQLAGALFVQRWSKDTGRTPDYVAGECISAARAFYRTWDEQNQPTQAPPG
ncbi:hypothetical protein VT84_14020 [Gemmata sp. SH-PL17]|uniref:hypothetical protein n=1 Tax=Gemmata sp. SH-PL17 TaxID=1630693 RepID=UPI00078ED90B|nr:hypothetical protein [Gemmata sp. SH-PL17]AMV25511.1 hypothetical protein VT84_14020 [Gemmata sp. SH-PL17]